MKYRVKVEAIYSDFVWVEAESEQQAESKALAEAVLEFDYHENSEATGERED